MRLTARLSPALVQLAPTPDRLHGYAMHTGVVGVAHAGVRRGKCRIDH
jgi:hypothetical protein